MLKHTRITVDRVRSFLSTVVWKRVLGEPRGVRVEMASSDADRPDGLDGVRWTEVEKGHRWGPAYATAWYRLSFDETVEGEVLTYGDPKLEHADDWATLEGTIWIDGAAVGGLDHGRSFFRLPEGRTELLVSTFAPNAQTALHGREAEREPTPAEMRGFHVRPFDDDVWQLAIDLTFALDLLQHTLDESDPCYHAILRAANQVCNEFDPERPRWARKARRTLRDALGSGEGSIAHTVTPVGHAHLDTAWLWPIHVTRLKMTHTTAVQLDLAERYPEHLFVHSQASQYEWLKDRQPELFERVREAIAARRWEPLGSMWVEADCNLTGAESLVRQFLYGRRWFKQELGVETTDMWLPDVFGYSAALPQILGKFGIQAFLTQKLSWSQFNEFPHHTFWWRGIDGSEVWTHFPPADTYNGTCRPQELKKSATKNRDHARSDRSLLPFGWGDGGGGPSEWHLELLRRARRAPGMPEIERGRRAKDFFRDAMQESDDLCVWSGELYLELHRGTYTSQAANKKANRECEFLLRDAEALSYFADGFPSTYPADRLEEAWKLVLLNQFHDIIPGSSVREVYQDSAVDYDRVRRIGAETIDDALGSIARKFDSSGFERPVALFQNATVPTEASIPWSEEREPASLRVGSSRLPVQLVEGLGERKLIFPTPHEALGSVALGDLTDEPPTVERRLKVGPRHMENGELAIRFDANGNLVSLRTMDDVPIEFLKEGSPANVFQLFDDDPLFWSAWDVDVFSLESPTPLLKADSVQVVERGPVRAAIEVVRSFGESTIRQRISLGPTPGVRFDTEIDWREENKLLKVAFPLAANASRATYEIQFGHVERPTHRNTSWDVARFEVCAQKWADVSEGGHGVALINDGKYGHDCVDDTLRLTLLRSPKAPDPTCDMGVHRFSYSLLPHFDGLRQSEVVASSYAFNAPLRHAFVEPTQGESGELPTFVSCDSRDVVIETVKRAEDSDRLVVRLYECHNTRGTATLECLRGIRKAWIADLNEKEVERLDVLDDAVSFAYGPFEIVTLLLEV